MQLSKNSKIFLAGHNGIVGFIILKVLKKKNNKNKKSKKKNWSDQPKKNWRLLKKNKTWFSDNCSSKGGRYLGKQQL